MTLIIAIANVVNRLMADVAIPTTMTIAVHVAGWALLGGAEDFSGQCPSAVRPGYKQLRGPST